MNSAQESQGSVGMAAMHVNSPSKLAVADMLFTINMPML